MIYLIGGASRANKSHLSRLFGNQHNIPYIELDYLKMGFANGLPNIGIHPLQREKELGDRLWPFVKGMIKAMVENRDDYIFEGIYILPEYVYELAKEYGSEIRSCFLGYEHADPKLKLDEIRKFTDPYHDPLKGYSDIEALEEIKHSIKFSSKLRKDCEYYNLPYLDAESRTVAVESAVLIFTQNS